MTDDLSTSANDRVATVDDSELWPLLRSRVAILVGALAVLVIGVVLIGTANTGPRLIKEHGNLVDIVGLESAFDLGEEHRLKARLELFGVHVPVENYDDLRTFKRNTKNVRIIVVVHPNDELQKRWWRWYYKPACER